MPWTEEMVESLKKMWDEGLSTGEIGRRLGVSKNSIVGKVHRLQLVARPSPIKKKDGTPVVKTKSADKEKAKTKAKTTPKENEPTPAKKEEKTVEAPKVETKVTAPQPETKPIPVKTVTKEKDYDAFVNVSIPVSHTPKKPGDKVTVTDLDNHTCRWPIGDPKDENFHFCGANVRIGQTYCEEHAAIAYVKNVKK